MIKNLLRWLSEGKEDAISVYEYFDEFPPDAFELLIINMCFSYSNISGYKPSYNWDRNSKRLLRLIYGTDVMPTNTTHGEIPSLQEGVTVLELYSKACGELVKLLGPTLIRTERPAHNTIPVISFLLIKLGCMPASVELDRWTAVHTRATLTLFDWVKPAISPIRITNVRTV